MVGSMSEAGDHMVTLRKGPDWYGLIPVGAKG